jgi:hypothetical protein
MAINRFCTDVTRHVGLMGPVTSCPAGPARVLQPVTDQLPIPSPVALRSHEPWSYLLNFSNFITSLFLVMPLNNVIDCKQSDASMRCNNLII